MHIDSKHFESDQIPINPDWSINEQPTIIDHVILKKIKTSSSEKKNEEI